MGGIRRLEVNDERPNNDVNGMNKPSDKEGRT